MNRVERGVLFACVGLLIIQGETPADPVAITAAYAVTIYGGCLIGRAIALALMGWDDRRTARKAARP